MKMSDNVDEDDSGQRWDDDDDTCWQWSPEKETSTNSGLETDMIRTSIPGDGPERNLNAGISPNVPALGDDSSRSGGGDGPKKADLSVYTAQRVGSCLPKR
ncbi:unnamed protein product [Nippostrongylus brasiliensis]|uniref:Uncharacterized protein n=1 Tax=Nippostrongylus brasiliensis TaxID=27835 RepID=A0A0N4XYG5_NIPBR|nr:unnamed protein product [Nippostrongylus brasiliensis]